jgi:hemoglobin-like flavoprotein
MTPEQIDLVEETLAALGPDLDAVAADFYRRLFAADPEVAALFTTEPGEQRAKFVAQFTTIVLAVRHHHRLVDEATALGRRHGAYGVRTRHYPVVGATLLAALAAARGDAWTPAAGEAWSAAYDLTAELMMAGAAPDGP